MIVRFPFVSDSRKTIKFPFVADNMPHVEELIPNDIYMLIKAENGIELYPTVYALPDEIGMIMNAGNDVVIDNIAIGMNDIYSSAMRMACNELQTNIETSILENGSGNLQMVIRADQTDTNLLIDATRTSLFKAWMALHINDLEWEYHIDTLLDEVNMKIRTQNNVDVGPITTSLDKLRTFMKIAESKDFSRIKDLDDLKIGILDAMQISNVDYNESLVDLHLEIGVVIDEDGNARLVVRASDDVGVVRGVPVTLAMIDANKLGELDGDVIPDYTYI